MAKARRQLMKAVAANVEGVCEGVHGLWGYPLPMGGVWDGCYVLPNLRAI